MLTKDVYCVSLKKILNKKHQLQSEQIKISDLAWLACYKLRRKTKKTSKKESEPADSGERKEKSKTILSKNVAREKDAVNKE